MMKNLFLFVFCLIVLHRSFAETSVRISEFVAINDSGLRDEDGDYSDWLELHNFGDQSIDLFGCFLTDQRQKPRRWQFPKCTIQSGEYKVIFLSGKNRKNHEDRLHTNFRLDGKGGYLAILAPDGKSPIHEIDPDYPKQKADIAFGFISQNEISQNEISQNEIVQNQIVQNQIVQNDFVKLPTFLLPSPGESNRSPIGGRVKAVKMSVKRGWFDAPFELALSTKTPDAEILYTRDGSLPTRENGFAYTRPFQIDRTTALRARAFKKGFAPSHPKTRTFLFLEDILQQSLDGLPPEGFPYLWGNNKVNYGMDARIVSNPENRETLAEGFYSLPVLSLVMDGDDLFDAKIGIYANAQNDGRNWERPCSLEMIPREKDGFGVDCGIRIRGGFSRGNFNPKHSFRFFFRDVYGSPRLDYPLFGEGGAQVFDHFDLRTFQNYAWHMGSDEAIFLGDQFCRDLQQSLGQPAARGGFCHLFINGHYWGLYNTCERIKASYGVHHFGGKRSQYDSIKKGHSYDSAKKRHLGIMANDGNLEAWERLWILAKKGLKTNEAYFKLLGRHSDGSIDSEGECLLDVDNLIDYMLVIFYSGNFDGPITAWGANEVSNNWYGIRHRKRRDGFRFFIWDAEHVFKDVREDRTGPFPAGDDFAASNPQWLWQQCLENEEFRVRVGDRIQKHFFGKGALTSEKVRARFLHRADSIAAATLCESARWGDAAATASGGNAPQHARLLTREKHWEPEIRRIADRYIPARSRVVLAQLLQHGVIADVPTPSYRLSENGFSIQFTASKGTIYATTNGHDPREIGGKVSPHARVLTQEDSLPLHSKMLVRTHYRGEWSALLNLSDASMIAEKLD